MALLHKGITMKDLIERLEATIHKINGHWWNRRKRPEAPDIRHAADLIQSQQSRIKELEGALESIAVRSDTYANEYLESTGSYAMFDEPASVETARTILSKLEGKTPIHPVKTRGTE